MSYLQVVCITTDKARMTRGGSDTDFPVFICRDRSLLGFSCEEVKLLYPLEGRC